MNAAEDLTEEERLATFSPPKLFLVKAGKKAREGIDSAIELGPIGTLDWVINFGINNIPFVLEGRVFTARLRQGQGSRKAWKISAAYLSARTASYFIGPVGGMPAATLMIQRKEGLDYLFTKPKNLY